MSDYNYSSWMNNHPSGILNLEYSNNIVNSDIITSSNAASNVEISGATNYSGGSKNKHFYKLSNTNKIISAKYPLDAARKFYKLYNKKTISFTNINNNKNYKYKF